MPLRLPRIPRNNEDLYNWLLRSDGVPDEAKCRAYLEEIADWSGPRSCPKCGTALPEKINSSGQRVCRSAKCIEFEATVKVGTRLHRRHIPASGWIFGAWEVCHAKGPMFAKMFQHGKVTNKLAHSMIRSFQWAMALDQLEETAPDQEEEILLAQVNLKDGSKIKVDLRSVKVGGRYETRAALSPETSDPTHLPGDLDREPLYQWNAFSRGWRRPPKDQVEVELRLAEFNFHQRRMRHRFKPVDVFIRLLRLLLKPLPPGESETPTPTPTRDSPTHPEQQLSGKGARFVHQSPP